MPIDAQVRVMRLTSVGDAPVGAASSELDFCRPLSWTVVSKIFRSIAMRAATVREGYFTRVSISAFEHPTETYRPYVPQQCFRWRFGYSHELPRTCNQSLTCIEVPIQKATAFHDNLLKSLFNASRMEAWLECFFKHGAI
jgi:hypothetical protein